MKYVIKREGEESKPGMVTLVAKEIVRGKTRQRTIEPDRSQKVWNHSPDGFEFGYGGSGPSQLALAILLDYTNDRGLAIILYQAFKWDFIAGMPHPGGEIKGLDIQEWIKKKHHEAN